MVISICAALIVRAIIKDFAPEHIVHFNIAISTTYGFVLLMIIDPGSNYTVVATFIVILTMFFALFLSKRLAFIPAIVIGIFQVDLILSYLERLVNIQANIPRFIVTIAIVNLLGLSVFNLFKGFYHLYKHPLRVIVSKYFRQPPPPSVARRQCA